MSGQVIHVSEIEAFPDAIYVGRASARYRLPASPLANPFRIGGPMTRGDAVEAFHANILRKLRDGEARAVETLIAARDHPLACWCRRSDEPITSETTCHADILLELLSRYTDDELRAMAG